MHNQNNPSRLCLLNMYSIITFWTSSILNSKTCISFSHCTLNILILDTIYLYVSILSHLNLIYNKFSKINKRDDSAQNMFFCMIHRNRKIMVNTQSPNRMIEPYLCTWSSIQLVFVNMVVHMIEPYL